MDIAAATTSAPTACRVAGLPRRLLPLPDRMGRRAVRVCDAVLCSAAPVTSVPALSLEPAFRRSHGSLYKALARGQIDDAGLRALLMAHRPLDWPLVFAVDASSWPRCDAETSPERGFYYSASKHSAGKPIVAGWSYQWISQLGWAPDSWTAPLDAQRIPPSANPTIATIDQVRQLLARLPADREAPMFVFDAGYDPIALGHDLAGQRARSWSGSARNGCSTPTRLPARPAPAAAHPGTGHASPCPTRQPAGQHLTPNTAPRTSATATCTSKPGADCTPN
jgi:hypothetical protein